MAASSLVASRYQHSDDLTVLLALWAEPIIARTAALGLPLSTFHVNVDVGCSAFDTNLPFSFALQSCRYTPFSKTPLHSLGTSTAHIILNFLFVSELFGLLCPLVDPLL